MVCTLVGACESRKVDLDHPVIDVPTQADTQSEEPTVGFIREQKAHQAEKEHDQKVRVPQAREQCLTASLSQKCRSVESAVGCDALTTCAPIWKRATVVPRSSAVCLLST